MTVEVLVDSEPALARCHLSETNRIDLADPCGRASGTRDQLAWPREHVRRFKEMTLLAFEVT